MKMLVMFTCFNRKEKTLECINSLKKNNEHDFTFVIADDGSSDGTYEALVGMPNIFMIRGCGQWFYSGGMRAAMAYSKEYITDNYDYLMLINDDVKFFDKCVDKLVEESIYKNNAVIVGIMQDNDGNETYGAIKYQKGISHIMYGTKDSDLEADTFNANCVLIPYQIFKKNEIMDNYYIHSLGDYDYGLALKRAGVKIYASCDTVGICETNSSENTWANPRFSRFERIKKKESPKGAPTKQWFYFLKKNFGLLTAIKGVITPYIRIIIGM